MSDDSNTSSAAFARLYLSRRAGGEDVYGAGVEYTPATGGRAWGQTSVLPELTGLPWDDLALSLVHGLRPTYIRVSCGELTCDSRLYRITVLLDEDGKIRSISQEIQILALYGHGHATRLLLNERRAVAGLSPVE